MPEESPKITNLQNKIKKIDEHIKKETPSAINTSIKKLVEKGLDIAFSGLKTSKENIVPSALRVARNYLGSITFNGPQSPNQPTTKRPGPAKKDPIIKNNPKLERLHKQKQRLEDQIQREQKTNRMKTAQEEIDKNDFFKTPDWNTFAPTFRKLRLTRNAIRGDQPILKYLENDEEVYTFPIRREVTFEEQELDKVKSDQYFKGIEWSAKGPILSLKKKVEKKG